MNFKDINREYKLRARHKHIYSYWLLAVGVFLLSIVAAIINWAKTPKKIKRILQPIKDSWSWSAMLMFCVISIPLGLIWLLLHYQPSFIVESVVGKEVFPAWHFVQGSVFFYKVVAGLFIADHVFLGTGMPFGLIFFWWFKVDKENYSYLTVHSKTQLDTEKKIKRNAILNICFASLLFGYLTFMAFFWDMSSMISWAIYCVPFFALWFNQAKNINFKQMIKFFAVMTSYVFIWEIVNTWAVGWIYGVEVDGSFIHSVLFNKNDPLLLSWWHKPISILLNYSWAGMFMMIPLCAKLRRLDYA